MRSSRKFLAFLVVPAVLFALGCDSDDGGTDTNLPDVPADVPADVPPADVPPADVPADIPVVKGPFKALLIDFQSKDPVAGATVAVLDNDTATPTGETTTSDANGYVNLELPKGIKVGFKVSGDSAKDTYQFNIDSEAQDETLWLVSETTYTLVPIPAGLAVDTTKGIVAGGLYFFNDKNANGKTDEGEEEWVGCATIETEPVGDYRYFSPDTKLPANNTDAPTTSKDISYFLAGNVNIDATGSIKVTAKVKGEVVGTVNVFSFADSICISNIYVTTATNPTPADCAQ